MPLRPAGGPLELRSALVETEPNGERPAGAAHGSPGGARSDPYNHRKWPYKVVHGYDLPQGYKAPRWFTCPITHGYDLPQGGGSCTPVGQVNQQFFEVLVTALVEMNTSWFWYKVIFFFRWLHVIM